MKFPAPLPFEAIGVGHPISAVSLVRRADARRRKRNRPEGITQGFHVSLYKVDPVVRVSAARLLAKDHDRTALANKPMCGGP
ncbi:hypothetical protein NUKP32_31930 [Klebsiella variicola]|nr:hypothetical protein NUKP32_31930 [Klebsiella variicola]